MSIHETKDDNLLTKHEDRWETDIGAWFPGHRVVFRGKDLFSDLGDMSWMELWLYAVTGRFFNKEQIRLFEALCTLVTSFPEPRLWNNRIAALAGTTRSTSRLGLSAAIAIEAEVFGHGANAKTLDTLFKAKDILCSGGNLEDFIKHELSQKRKIGGFGRPLTKADERISPIMDLARKLGLADGDYVRTVFEMEKILLRNDPPINMNVSALATALVADQGLSREEINYYRSSFFSIGIIACYISTIEKPEGTFFPLNCNRINYTGHPHRNW